MRAEKVNQVLLRKFLTKPRKKLFKERRRLLWGMVAAIFIVFQLVFWRFVVLSLAFKKKSG